MRAYAAFLAAIAGTLLLTALVAYPVYAGLHALQPEWAFHKIASRLWQLLMLGAVIVVVWRLRLGTKRDWGYGVPRPAWLRQFGIGLALGLATMLPVTLTMIGLGVRPLRPELSLELLTGAFFAGLASGLAVGFVEETFFRGLLQGAVMRETRRPAIALVAVAVLYSALHFLDRVRIPHEQVDWGSGLVLLGGVLGKFAAFGTIVDAFLCLVAVGLVLGVVTWWSGSIALAVGLHAGWVWMMRTTVGVTAADESSPLAWTISESTGYTGWLVLGWTLVVLAALPWVRRRWPAAFDDASRAATRPAGG
ncbi:MAG: CPBP family glutamic-type intramembrane protease [Steroidobacteraceae bacterium]|jgi:membrane protease YdiL (CAAX protease family)|nr:CPBP family glutamic-type intramembrane protease [Steroidobacteraceae bacterium]